MVYETKNEFEENHEAILKKICWKSLINNFKNYCLGRKDLKILVTRRK